MSDYGTSGKLEYQELRLARSDKLYSARLREAADRGGSSIYVGRRSGKLVTFAVEGFDAYGNRMCRCRCDCGGFVTVRFTRISTGKTKSCGCLQRRACLKSIATWNKERRSTGQPAPNFTDRTGLRLGRLTITGRGDNDRKNRTTWLCLCDCGNSTTVAWRSLLTGQTRSCGCMRGEAARRLANTVLVKFRYAKTI